MLENRGLDGEGGSEGCLFCRQEIPGGGERDFNSTAYLLDRHALLTRVAALVLREMGIRLIDDILLMSESETELRGHIAGMIYLLENLGVVKVINQSVIARWGK